MALDLCLRGRVSTLQTRLEGLVASHRGNVFESSEAVLDRASTRLYCWHLIRCLKRCLRSLSHHLTPQANGDAILGQMKHNDVRWCSNSNNSQLPDPDPIQHRELLVSIEMHTQPIGCQNRTHNPTTSPLVGQIVQDNLHASSQLAKALREVFLHSHGKRRVH